MSVEQGHWSKFGQAASDLKEFRRLYKPEWQDTVDQVIEILAESHKFYVPAGRTIIDRKEHLDTDARFTRLPFDLTAVLSSAPNISFIALGIPFDSPHINPPFSFRGRDDVSDKSFVMFGLIKSLDMRGWTLMPPIPAIAATHKGEWRTLLTGDPKLCNDFEKLQPEYRDYLDVTATCLLNLTALLSCVNVKSVERVAPKFLSQKRARTGKPPLYSYHVLEVDGERWESEGADSNSAHGVRSHYRRGHIRHLEDRSVWVRETFVRGSVRGFVDKDYSIASGVSA